VADLIHQAVHRVMRAGQSQITFVMEMTNSPPRLQKPTRPLDSGMDLLILLRRWTCWWPLLRAPELRLPRLSTETCLARCSPMSLCPLLLSFSPCPSVHARSSRQVRREREGTAPFHASSSRSGLRPRSFFRHHEHVLSSHLLPSAGTPALRPYSAMSAARIHQLRWSLIQMGPPWWRKR
jgi:hypothetical protein